MKYLNPSVELVIEREKIEVTRSGILPPFVADHARKFIPGPPDYRMRQDGLPDWPLTEDQAQQLLGLINDKDEDGISAFAQSVRAKK